MWLYVGLGLIALVVYLLTSSKFDYWEKIGVPTASGCERFFGHLRPLLFLTKHLNDYYGAMYKEFPDAPLVGYYSMSVPGLLVRDLDLIKFITVSEFSSFNSNRETVDKDVDPLSAPNPFYLVGDEWKTERSRLAPALTVVKLKGYLPSMLDVGDEMVKYIKNNVGPLNALETWELARRFTTDVIANSLFGLKSNTFEDKDSFVACITRNIKFNYCLWDNLKLFVQQISIVRSFFPLRFTSPKTQNMLVSLTSKTIAERMATGENRNDLFQVLMNLKKNDTEGVYTDEYMSGYLFTIIVDLYEATSNIICLILYRLSRYPEIQKKLRDEISKIKSSCIGELTFENIESAKYLDMVICEGFRIDGQVLARECTQDCYLPVPNANPIKITKGTPITIPANSIQMDPKYYPDPETFNPERFTEEEIAKRPKFTFMPFGEGPKKCPGTRITILVIKIALIKIIEKFTLQPSPKTKYPLQYNPAAPRAIRSKDPTWVIFEEI